MRFPSPIRFHAKMTTLLSTLTSVALIFGGFAAPAAGAVSSAPGATPGGDAVETGTSPLATPAQCREWRITNPALFRKYCL